MRRIRSKDARACVTAAHSMVGFHTHNVERKKPAVGFHFMKSLKRPNGTVAIRDSHVVVTGLKESKGVFTGRDQQGSS